MVKVIFKSPMMKGGIQREVGDEMEMVDSAAALLAERGNVEIPGKKVVRVKKEVEVVEIVDV